MKYADYITNFIQEMREALYPLKKRLVVGVPRGDILGPPMSNAMLQWRHWVEADLIDELVINQNSSRCPSMWHDLWPMHSGYVYIQNYLWGANLPSLIEHISSIYAPVFNNHAAKLYIARQWEEFSQKKGARLLTLPGVTGPALSSFRYDNPGQIKINDWRA